MRRGAGQSFDPLLMSVEHRFGLRPGQLLGRLADLRHLGEDAHSATGQILKTISHKGFEITGEDSECEANGATPTTTRATRSTATLSRSSLTFTATAVNPRSSTDSGTFLQSHQKERSGGAEVQSARPARAAGPLHSGIPQSFRPASIRHSQKRSSVLS